MQIITEKEAEKNGITTIHHEMDNGEQRYRLTRNTGSSYILTLSPDHGAWQNSHYHLKKREFYVVEKGWILTAVLDHDQLILRQIEQNETFMVAPGVRHNLYLPENTVLHTVKYGTEEQDWHPDPELDDRIQKETEIRK